MQNQQPPEPYKIDENHVRLAGTNTTYPCRPQPSIDLYCGLTKKTFHAQSQSPAKDRPYFAGDVPVDFAQRPAKSTEQESELPLPCQVCQRTDKYLKCKNLEKCTQIDGDHGFSKASAQRPAKSTEPCSQAELYRLRNSGGSCSNPSRD